MYCVILLRSNVIGKIGWRLTVDVVLCFGLICRIGVSKICLGSMMKPVQSEFWL